MLTFSQAKKLSIPFYGRPGDVQLLVSLDQKTTLSVGWFHDGPRGGLTPSYAVRLGLENGVALHGCCKFDSADEALAYFEKYAQK